jgi:nucleotide-binding universal stress UspA family protein
MGPGGTAVTDLFDRIVVPVADPDDAAATCRALDDYDVGAVLAVHVIEKAGGAPDKASVEQREEYAAEIFEVVTDHLDGTADLETRVAFGTDVAETIFEVADEFDATSVVITPRGGSRWVRLLTGDVALSLVTETDRPVVVLPDVEQRDEEANTGDTAGEAGNE